MHKVVFHPEDLGFLEGASEIRRFVERIPTDGQRVELSVSQIWRDSAITFALRVDGGDPVFGQMESGWMYGSAHGEEVSRTLETLFGRQSRPGLPGVRVKLRDGVKDEE